MTVSVSFSPSRSEAPRQDADVQSDARDPMRAVECRRTVRRNSGTPYSTMRSFAAADLLLMLEDAEIARVAGLHSAERPPFGVLVASARWQT